MRWYKRDPDAALIGMRGLSHDAKSAYGTIIDLSYSRDGDVPDDEHFLCMHIECRPQWWRRVKQELLFHRKIRIISGKLVANRVETTLKEAANWSETQSKRARQGWVSRKNNNEINTPELPLGNAITTTTTLKEKEEKEEKEKMPSGEPARSLASALPMGALAPSPEPAKPSGPSPPPAPQLPPVVNYRDPGLDYRSPPRTKIDNVLQPLPEYSVRPATKPTTPLQQQLEQPIKRPS